jgi:hypothetical protein
MLGSKKMTLGLLKKRKAMSLFWISLIGLALVILFWLVSYLRMLERQEGNLVVFAPAVIELLKNPNQTVALNDQSGRFLARGNPTDLQLVLATKGWVLIDQMGASMKFRFNDKEFSIVCRQFTTQFMVCQP